MKRCKSTVMCDCREHDNTCSFNQLCKGQKIVTNAEAIIQGLQNIEEDEVAVSVANYIACPFSVNPLCEYDGNVNSCCIDCKIEWLKKEFEG